MKADRRAVALQKYAMYLADFDRDLKLGNYEKIRSKMFRSDKYIPEPLTFGQWCLEHPDIEGLQRGMRRNRQRNHEKYDHMSQFINGDPAQGRINPEYLANAEAAREENKRRGHDRDAVKQRTIELERAAESRLPNPEDWQPKETPALPAAPESHRPGLLKRMIGRLASAFPGGEPPQEDYRDYLGWKEKK